MILGDSKRRALIGFGVMGMVIINSALGVTARRGKVVKKSGEVSDENGIILENDYIRAAMVTNDLGGQVMSLIYKPTGQELAPARHHMGYCLDRMGEGRYYFKRAGKDHRGEILSQSDEKAETKYSYIWKYNRHDLKTEVLCTKIYTLRKDAAYLEVVWTFKNIGKQKAIMTPWIKHVGGHDDVLLNGGRVLLNEGGAYDPGGAFVNAVTNWNIRQSKVGNSEEYPMACSCTDFAPLFQQFDWTGKERYTLETIMSRITLEPGKSWQLPYTISFMPNLAKPVFGAPELAASFETKEEPAPGKSCNVTVHVSGAHNFGEVRLEGDVRKLEGETVEKLPNRQIVIAPGKISTAEYTFTPPANGVYNLNLSVFIGQQPYKLGDFVEAQQTMMVLPVVVGPKPAKVVKKWQSGGFSWPRRKPKDIIPWRSLVKNERVQVGQLKVLDRFYPEYSLTCKDGTEPARIRLAKGEYEDVQFVVQFANPEDVLKQEIEVSPLSHRSGAKISKVQLKEAIYLTTEVPSNYLNFPIGQYPDPLMNYGWEKKIPDAEVTKKNLDVFKKSGKRSFWLVLKSPSDAPDGIFAGKITIRTEGKVVGEFPLEVEVEPFALPRRASYRCSTGMVGWKNVDRQLEVLKMPKEEIKRVLDNTNGMDSYRRLVIEYGWTPVMWFGFAQLQKYYDYGRGVSVCQLRLKNKTNPKHQEPMKWVKEKGLLDYTFIYAPFDEHSNEVVPDVAKWCRKWKEESDIPILDCFYGSNVQPLFGLVDIWLGQNPKQEWAKERKKKGDRFFAVNSSLIWHVEYEPVGGRAAFWQDHASGYDGRYVYSTCRWTNDLFKKNWTSGNYMGSAVYPSPDGVTTSIRFEAMRDGIDDYEYLSILKRLVEKNVGSGVAAVKEAKAILVDEQLGKKLKSVDDLYAMRAKVADLIAELIDE